MIREGNQRERLMQITYWFCILCSVQHAHLTEASIFRGTAAIFGLSNTRAEANGNQDGPIHQLPVHPYPSSAPPGNADSLNRPPPPPPPPKGVVHRMDIRRSSDTNQTFPGDDDARAGSGMPHRPPPPTFFGAHGPPPPGEPWMMGPPQPGDWQSFPPEDEFQQMPPGDTSFFSALQQDLDLSVQRELELQERLSNASIEVATLKQREELHIRQLDVLTERVMETEATAASERNQLLQYQANCTEMSEELRILEGSVEEWKTRCEEHLERVKQSEEEVGDLKKKVKSLSRKSEDLAAIIERHRLDEESASKSRAVSTYGRKTKKSRGFFGWLFGWGDDDEYDEEEELEEAHRAGRATLLEALQRERDNVEELETAVASLQQNNSAIAEQVHSRNLIISELNDRVAVFEEDKVVLKAALKQLQKEMKDEAPKTQEIILDLQKARQEVDRLNAEVESLVATHRDEIATLQEAISEKQDAIQETESNLTVIGGYVDKLEERLADFAIARRDIAKREEVCLHAEKLVSESKMESDKLRARLAQLENEHAELRKLFEELIHVRTKLQNECNQLKKERDAVRRNRDRLQQNLNGLNEQVQSLRRDKDFWQTRSQQVEQELNSTLSKTARLESDFRKNTSNAELLQRQIDETAGTRLELEELVRTMEASRLELKQKVISLEEGQNEAFQESRLIREKLEKKELELEEAQQAIDKLKSEYDSELESLLESTREKDAALAKAEKRAVNLQDEVEKAVAREVEFREEAAAREAELRGEAARELELQENERERDAALREAEERAARLQEEVAKAAAREVEFRKEAVARETELRKEAERALELQKATLRSKPPPAPPLSTPPPPARNRESPTKKEGNLSAVGAAPPESELPDANSAPKKDQASPKTSPMGFVHKRSGDEEGLTKNPTAPSFGLKTTNEGEVKALQDEKRARAVNTTSASDTAVNRTSPPLPASLLPPSSNTTSRPPQPKGRMPPRKERKVPLRKVRKFFSKATGIHGFFTPSSQSQRVVQKKGPLRPPEKRVKKARGAPGPPTGGKGGLPVRSFGKGPPPSKTAAASSPRSPQSRPDVIKHTLGGIRFPQSKEPKS